MKFSDFQKEARNRDKSWQQILSQKEGVHQTTKKLAREIPGGGFCNAQMVNNFINKFQ